MPTLLTFGHVRQVAFDGGAIRSWRLVPLACDAAEEMPSNVCIRMLWSCCTTRDWPGRIPGTRRCKWRKERASPYSNRTPVCISKTAQNSLPFSVECARMQKTRASAKMCFAVKQLGFNRSSVPAAERSLFALKPFSDPHRHHDVAVFEAVIAAVVGAHLAG